jgi:hypothetical protein
MRYILALFSAFFMSFYSYSGIYDGMFDMSDLKAPNGVLVPMYGCGRHGHGESGVLASHPNIGGCIDAAIAAYDGGDWTFNGITETQPSGFTKTQFKWHYATRADGSIWWKYVTLEFNVLTSGEDYSYSCPPASFPEHENEVPDPNNPSKIKCAKSFKPEDCPVGHHPKSVSHMLGDANKCFIKECPAAGASEHLYSSPNMGGDSLLSGGVFCDAGCAYSVGGMPEGSTGNSAVGTSIGASCGTPTDIAKKLGDNPDECDRDTSTEGIEFLYCSAPTPDSPEPLTDPKADEEKEEKKLKEDCLGTDSLSDVNCNLKNIEKENENSKNEQLENTKELHNKKLESDKQNTSKITDSVDSLGAQINGNAKSNELANGEILGELKAINASLTNGTGSGGGDSGGGDCVGDSCTPDGGYPDLEMGLDEIDKNLETWIAKKDEIPNAVNTFIGSMADKLISNLTFAVGQCVPFTLNVSIRGESKQIVVDKHCVPYDAWAKQLVEWLLWVFTAFNILQTAYSIITRRV